MNRPALPYMLKIVYTTSMVPDSPMFSTLKRMVSAMQQGARLVMLYPVASRYDCKSY
jgi:hypothetical protein